MGNIKSNYRKMLHDISFLFLTLSLTLALNLTLTLTLTLTPTVALTQALTLVLVLILAVILDYIKWNYKILPVSSIFYILFKLISKHIIGNVVSYNCLHRINGVLEYCLHRRTGVLSAKEYFCDSFFFQFQQLQRPLHKGSTRSAHLYLIVAF